MSETIEQFLTSWSEAERTGDSVSLANLLTDDFLGVGPLGFVLPKDAWLSRFDGGLLDYESFHLEEPQIRDHGESALVTARQVGLGTIAGNPLPFESVRATLSLIRQSGRWQLAGIHLSFIAGTPGAPPVPSAGQKQESAAR